MDISGLKIILVIVLIMMSTILLITYHVNRFNDYYTTLRNLFLNADDIKSMQTKPNELEKINERIENNRKKETK